MQNEIGKIRLPERASQLIEFAGIRFENASPSDIDGLLEIHNKMFVLLEYKHASAPPMSCGQRKAIGRVTDQLGLNGKHSCALIAKHWYPVGMIIEGANAIVMEVRWNGQWHNIEDQSRTVANCITGFYNYVFKNPFKNHETIH